MTLFDNSDPESDFIFLLFFQRDFSLFKPGFMASVGKMGDFQHILCYWLTYAKPYL